MARASGFSFRVTAEDSVVESAWGLNPVGERWCFCFHNGSDGPLSRTCDPGTHASLSLQPVTLRSEDVIQLLDLVSVSVCDGSNFCSLSDHSLILIGWSVQCLGSDGSSQGVH